MTTPPLSRKRRLWRGLVRFCMGLAILLLILRVSLPLWLPTVLDRVGASLGLQIRYGELDLRLFAGDLELRDLVVTTLPTADAAPSDSEPRALARVDYLAADLGMLDLFDGNVRVRQVSVGRADVVLERTADGAWNLPAMPSDPEAPKDEPEADPAGPADFRLPLWIDRVDVAALSLTVDDLVENRHIYLEAGAELLDLGRVDQTGQLRVDMRAPGLFQDMRLTVDVTQPAVTLDGYTGTPPRALELDFTGALTDLNPDAVAEWVPDLGAFSKELDGALAGHLKIAATDALGGARTELVVRKLQANALGDEGASVAGLQTLTMVHEHGPNGRTRIGPVVMDGLSFQAGRGANGMLRFLGFELQAGAKAVAQANAPVLAPDATTDATPIPETPPIASTPPVNEDMLLAGVEISNSTLNLSDATTGVDLELKLERFSLGPMDLVGGQGRKAEFQATLSAAGLFTSLDVSGMAQLGGPAMDPRHIVLQLALRELDLNVLAPYLNDAGLSWPDGIADLDLAVDLTLVNQADGGLEINAELNDLVFTGTQPADQDATADGATEQPWLGLKRLSVQALRVAPNGDLDIGEVVIDTPRLAMQRDADGALHVAGLRFQPAPVALDTPSETSESNQSDAPANEPVPETNSQPAAKAGIDLNTLPRVRLKRLALTGTALTFVDHSVDPPRDLAPETLAFELTDLDLFGEAATRAPFRLSIAKSGIMSELTLEGALQAQRAEEGSGTLNLSLGVIGRGLSTERISGLLAAAGIEGAIREGALDLQLDTTVTLDPNAAPAIALTLQDVDVRTETGAVLSLAQLDFDGFVAGPDGLVIPLITIQEPVLHATRNAEGAFGLGGLVMGTPPAPEPAPLERLKLEDALAGTSENETATAPPADQVTPPAIRLAGLQLAGAALVLESAGQPDALRINLSTTLGALDLAQPAPTPFTLQASIPGYLKAADLALTLTPDPRAPRATGRLDFTGFNGPALNGWLPENVTITTERGTLGLAIEATATLGDETLGAQLELTELNYKNGKGETLIALDRVALHINEYGDQVIDIQEVAVTGVRLDARRTLDGALVLPGLTIRPAATPVAAAPEAEPAETPTAVAADLSATTDMAPTSAPPTIWHPRLALQDLQIELAHLGWYDETAPNPEALDLKLVLALVQPYAHDPDAGLGDDGDDDPDEAGFGGEASSGPLTLMLTLNAAPILEALEIQIGIDPFAADPHLHAELDLRGLSGPDLERTLPAFAKALDASAVTSGELTAVLDAALRVRRRGPLEFDWESGLGGDFELSDLAWRIAPDAEPELGLQRLTGELANADARGVLLTSIELDRPFGSLTLTDAGAAIGGFVIKTPAEPAPAATTEDQDAVALKGTLDDVVDDVVDGATDSLVEAEPEPEPEPELVAQDPVAATPEVPAFHFEVREVLFSGLDFVVRDERVKPPMVLPLNDFELEVRGLSSRLTSEPIPLSFTGFVGAGTIELAERHNASNVVTGLLGSVGGAVLGADDEFDMEQRPAFGGLDFSGRLTLYPLPTGWASLELYGLELPNFRGEVLAAGIDLGDGLLDLNVDLRFLGDRGTAVSTRTRAEYLSLSEPPGGPISTYLKLPAPLDTVLFLLRDEDGIHTLPVDFRVTPEGGTEGLLSAVSTAIGRLVGDAIASSPLRFVGGVLDLAQFGEDKTKPLPSELYGVRFLPGSPEVETKRLLDSVQPILSLMRKDPAIKVDLTHVFTDADMDRFAEVTTPDAGACRDLVSRLRRERDELIGRRDRLAIELRTDYALGVQTNRAAKHGELADMDAELALLEESLDGMLEFLRPDGERRADRRIRAAALMVAEERLETVRLAIRDLAIQSIGERIRVRRARMSEKVEEGAGGSVYVLPRR